MNSRIILAKGIKLDRDYNNVLNYTTEQMLSLLRSNSHLINEANNYSFIRSTRNKIFVSFSYNECLQANYIAFQNPDYSNKWFFAWIDEVIFKGSTNGCEITFTIDSWTTWFEKVTTKPCFVVREHVNDDTIGINTIQENLDVGEVIEEQETTDLSYSNSLGYWVVVASNWQIKDNSTGDEVLESDKGSQYAGITVYDNVVFGSQLFLIEIKNISSFKNLYLLLSRTNYDGHIEDVENLFIVPNLAIDETKLTSHSAKLTNDESLSFTWYTLQQNMTPETFDTNITKRTSFSDFQPKNNKCFVYPYNYLLVSNNQGSNNIYKYEDFTTENCVFENQLAISVGCSGRLVPKNYKGMTTNDDEAIALGKYPTCAWSSDAFTNWLTQNGVNIAVGLGLAAGGIAASALTFGAAAAPTAAATAAFIGGTTMSISNTVGNTIGQFHQANLLPNINGGQATGDVIWAVDKNMFVIKEMRVKTEYLRIIDDYFTRFGYKSNLVKVPNITGRQYWNYVEIGSSEEIGYGEIPSAHMQIINNACRKGVTIWHSHENIGNYNLNNIIVA